MKLLIRDNETGKVFEYGTNRHHALVISDNGGCLTFKNLQNGDGSLEDGKGGYSFVTENGKTPQEDMETYNYGLEYANIGGFGDVEQEKPLHLTPEQFEAIYNDNEDEQ